MGNGLNQAMTAVLCLAWVIIYYSMMNGSEQAGAKLYFVAMCPYVILTIFLGMGLRSGCKNVYLDVIISGVNYSDFVTAYGAYFTAQLLDTHGVNLIYLTS